jgi:hypothetical protein
MGDLNGRRGYSTLDGVVARPERLVSLGNGGIVYLRDRCVQVSAPEKRMLELCDTVRPIPEQLSRICQALRMDINDAASSLHRLVRMGLLVDAGACVDSYRSSAVHPDGAGISVLAVVTHDRPEELRRCVSSLLETAARANRQAEIVVIDHSDARSSQEANRRWLSALPTALELRYCGDVERDGYRQRLAAEHVPPDLIDFAIMPARRGQSYGAARNALLFDTIGEKVLCADDDTVAQPATHRDGTPGLTLIGHQQWCDYWTFASRDEVLAWSNWVDTDIVDDHERLLGKTVSQCVAEAWPDVRAALCSHLSMEDSERPRRVIGTMPGRIGDAGRSDAWWLALVNASCVSGAGFTCRHVAEVPRGLAIAHYVGCMTTMWGIDNREMLPPFFPHFRGEDTTFGSLVTKTAPDACWGIVPHAILHHGAGVRSNDGEAGQSFQDLLCCLIEQSGLLPRSGTMAGRLRLLGRRLAEFAQFPRQDFVDACRVGYGRQVAMTSAGLDRAAATADVPEVAAMLRAEQQRQLARLTCEELLLPCEFAEDGWPAVQLAVHRFGRMLSDWPELMTTARRLRAKGVRLSSRCDPRSVPDDVSRGFGEWSRSGR